VPGIVQQNVLGFQITIHDVKPMQMLEGAEELRGVEATPVLVEFALSLEVVEEFSAVD
jgi:hypothetical protein